MLGPPCAFHQIRRASADFPEHSSAQGGLCPPAKSEAPAPGTRTRRHLDVKVALLLLLLWDSSVWRVCSILHVARIFGLFSAKAPETQTSSETLNLAPDC